MNMKTARYVVWCVVAALAVSPAFGQVTADPESVTFRNQEDSQTIRLSHDGRPVPASAIGKVEFLVDTHTYEHMIRVERQDGAVVVTPTVMESGWYTLVIHTDMGTASVVAYAPLAHIAESLAERAAALGIPVAQLEERLGLAQRSRIETIDIELPPVYYEGQSIIVNAPESPEAVHIWTINDEEVARGMGTNRLVYTPKQTGDLILTYVKEVGGAIVASDTAATRVIPLPSVPATATVNRAITFHGPSGYGTYTWTLDGQAVGSDSQLQHTFATPGTHVLVCEARGGADDMAEAYRRVTYKVTVEPPSF